MGSKEDAQRRERPERLWSIDLAARAGERVRLAGWLHRLRRLSNVSFLVLRDARGLAQVVVEDPALAADLLTRAHRRCPYSRAVAGNIPVTLSFAGKPIESPV